MVYDVTWYCYNMQNSGDKIHRIRTVVGALWLNFTHFLLLDKAILHIHVLRIKRKKNIQGLETVTVVEECQNWYVWFTLNKKKLQYWSVKISLFFADFFNLEVYILFEESITKIWKHLTQKLVVGSDIA